MSEKEIPNYYAIIPASVRYAKIPANAKLLYGEITALCNKEGFCWASNAYFGSLYGVSKGTVSLWISILEINGFIAIQLHKNYERRIYLSQPLPKKLKPHTEKAEPPLPKKLKPPTEKAEDNITDNIKNNITDNKSCENSANFTASENVSRETDKGVVDIASLPKKEKVSPAEIFVDIYNAEQKKNNPNSKGINPKIWAKKFNKAIPTLKIYCENEGIELQEAMRIWCERAYSRYAHYRDEGLGDYTSKPETWLRKVAEIYEWTKTDKEPQKVINPKNTIANRYKISSQ